jgi:dihydroneopterin aldolase
LQETLCEAIAALCLGDARVRRVKVRTVKADVYPDARVGCEIVRER